MKIHLADTIQRERLYPQKFLSHNLESYYMLSTKRDNLMEKHVNIFLDSGAFSAWSKGVKIDIDEYIKFIKEHEDYLEVYAVLDDINDPAITWKNQLYMEKQGVNPLPCFHYGEDEKWLKRYLKKYEYIALGGMVPIPNQKLVKWLDEIFSKYICDEKGIPQTKIHGFGLTSIPLMIRYPWYSVDSTSWVLTGRFGAVYVPKTKNGKRDYLQIPYKINISDKSPKVKEAGSHFSNLSKAEQKYVIEYFSEKGYTPEELSSEYQKRDEINIHYFLDLEKFLPPWPQPFKLKSQKGLGLI